MYGNINYLTFFSLTCEMGMIVVSILRVFIKAYEFIFGKHFAANRQLISKLLGIFLIYLTLAAGYWINCKVAV